MPTQRSVAVQFWTSRAVRAFSPAAKLLALYFITNSESHFSGLGRLSFEICEEETGLSRVKILALLPTLQAVQADGEPYLVYDSETRVTWVVKRLEYEFPKRKMSGPQRTAIKSILSRLPISEVPVRCCERYSKVFPLGAPFDEMLDTLSHRVCHSLSDSLSDTPRIRLSALGSRLSALGSQIPLVGAAPPQVAAPEEQGGNSPEAILAWLNGKAGRNYRPVDANLSFIRARLKDGILPEQLKAIVTRKVREWKGTEQAKYLRPATIFNREKCEQYVGELPAPEVERDAAVPRV